MNEASLKGTPRWPRPLGQEENAWRLAWAGIAALVLALFVIRLTGYPNLFDNEERIAAYVLDAVQNGNWVVQKDATGDIASKPPLLTWSASVVALLQGRITRLALYLPSALSVVGTASLLLLMGRKTFGWRAGFLSAAMFVLSPSGYTELQTARYDGVLALPVTLAAWAAFRAWTNGSSWTWFWAAGALGTFVKGPIALLLGAAGLLAAVTERRSDSRAHFQGSHVPGVLLFLAVTGGWFALAYGQLGQPLLDKMIGRELVGHAVGTTGRWSFWGFFEPATDFAIGFVPWSLLAVVSMWRVWKRPSSDMTHRRFELFLFWWFITGLILFSLSPHHRSRLIFPLFPAAALLAGRELAAITRSWNTSQLFKIVGTVAAVVATLLWVHAHVLLRHSIKAQRTLGLQAIAKALTPSLRGGTVVTHTDSPFGLQFYLNEVRPNVSFARAAALLRGETAAWIAVRNFAALEKELGPNPPPLYELTRWPATGEPFIRVVGNRPLTNSDQHAAFLLGPLRVEMEHAELIRSKINYRTGDELAFSTNSNQDQIYVVNEGNSPEKLQVSVLDRSSETLVVKTNCVLAPGQTWRFPGPGA